VDREVENMLTIAYSAFSVEKPGLWESFQNHTMGNIAGANERLKKAGMPILEPTGSSVALLDADHIPSQEV
jgi:hypothetical protein